MVRRNWGCTRAWGSSPRTTRAIHSWHLNQGPDQRLRRMLAYGLITRTEYPEVPLRVEYHLTPVGEKLASVIEQLRALETELRAPKFAKDCCSGGILTAEMRMNRACSAISDLRASLGALPPAAGIDMKPRLWRSHHLRSAPTARFISSLRQCRRDNCLSRVGSATPCSEFAAYLTRPCNLLQL